ncbi:MAG: AsmA family protein [Desulfobacterales bacterium]|jgi:hypothetical protein
MRIRKIIGWATLLSAILVVLLIAAVALAMTFGITINLDGFRSQVDAAATKALGRDVTIAGSVELVVSFQPGLEVRGVRIGNPKGWPQGDLARAERVRGEIDIIPLLGGKVQVGEIRADGVLLSLETTDVGEKNWEFNISGRPQPAEAQAPPSDGTLFPIEFVELRQLALNNVAVDYRDGGLEKNYQFRLDSLNGTAVSGEPMDFNARGSFQTTPFNFTLTGDPFEEFMKPQNPWKLEMSGSLGDSPIRVNGSFHPKGSESEASLQIAVERASLGGLIKELGISDSMEVDLDHFSVQIDARGGNLKEIIEQSNFSSTLENGRWFWPDPEKQLDMEFRIIKGVIRSPAGKPIELDLEGQVQKSPFLLALKGRPFAELALTTNPWDMQLTASLSDAEFRGKAQLVRQSNIPEVIYELVSKNVNLGNLLQNSGIAEGIDANIDKLQLNITARGSNPRELIELSEARILLENSRYVQPIINRDKAMKLWLNQGTIQLQPNKPIRMDIKGKLDRQPYAVAIDGGTLVDLLLEEKPWHLNISGKFEHAPLQAGITLIRPNDIPEARIDIKTGTIEVGEILDWLGIARGIKAKVGSMRVNATARGRNQLELLNRSDFDYSLIDGTWSLQNPNMKSRLDVSIKEFRVTRLAASPININASGHLTKVPAGKNEPSVKFDIKATARQTVPVESAMAKVGGAVNRFYQLDASGKFADSKVMLTGSLDQRHKEPVAALDFKAGPVNLGSMLSWLEIARGLEASVGGFEMNIDASGNDVEEVLSQSNFKASINDGHWILRDPNTNASVNIGIKKGAIQALAGKPITFALDGRLKETPININLHTESLAAFSGKIDRLPLGFDIQAAATRLKMTADLALPITSKTMGFNIDLRGQKLDSLDELLGVSLPPLGPYSLGGQFAMDDKGYRISEFEVRLGQSDLSGNAVLKTKGAKPDLNIELGTKILQINDFDFGDWSAIEPERPRSEEKDAPADMKLLLGPEVMQSMDARLAVNVNEVLSGQDSLGSGTVMVTLKNGRFAVDPLRLEIPGGAVDMSFAYKPTGKAVLAEAFANIDKFDFGVLARRAKADTKMKGLLSLDLKLKSQSLRLDTVMQNADGHINFGIWPEDLESGIIDLWAVNLFTAILPQVDKEKTSRVNCIIGNYKLDDGLLREDRMIIDTTRMRVKGEARVDFKKEDVYLYLKSSGKKPEFFSLATPIEVRGKISDFKIGVAPGGLFGTTIRFITSPLHVPLRRLFSEDLPPAGNDICESPLTRDK